MTVQKALIYSPNASQTGIYKVFEGTVKTWNALVVALTMERSAMGSLGPYVEVIKRANGTSLIRQTWPKRIRAPGWPATQFILETKHSGDLTPEEVARVGEVSGRNYAQMYDFKIGRGPPAPETDEWLGLIQREERSWAFRTRAAITQFRYRKAHDRVLSEFRRGPHLSPRRITDSLVEGYLDRAGLCHADTAEFLRCLRRLLERATHEDLRPPHMKFTVKIGKAPESQCRLWYDDDVHYVCEFTEDYGLPGLAALTATLWCTGQRAADVRLFRYGANYLDGCFWFRTRKTNEAVFLEAPDALRELLDARERPGEYLFTNRAGEPWTTKTLAGTFGYVRSKMARYEGQMLRLSHLRHSVVTDLALADCTIPQIASVTRHSLKSVYRILEAYLPEHPVLAAEAQRKRNEAHIFGRSGELNVEGRARMFVGQLPTPQRPRAPAEAVLHAREARRRPYWTLQRAIEHAQAPS